jgi:hypothetical protein
VQSSKQLTCVIANVLSWVRFWVFRTCLKVNSQDSELQSVIENPDKSQVISLCCSCAKGHQTVPKFSSDSIQFSGWFIHVTAGLFTKPKDSPYLTSKFVSSNCNHTTGGHGFQCPKWFDPYNWGKMTSIYQWYQPTFNANIAANIVNKNNFIGPTFETAFIYSVDCYFEKVQFNASILTAQQDSCWTIRMILLYLYKSSLMKTFSAVILAGTERSEWESKCTIVILFIGKHFPPIRRWRQGNTYNRLHDCLSSKYPPQNTVNAGFLTTDNWKSSDTAILQAMVSIKSLPRISFTLWS